MKKIIIICTYVIKTIAINFVELLTNMGYDASYKYKLTKEECMEKNNDALYIIMYYDEIHNLVPNYYIIYQIEQSNSSHNKKVLSFMKNSICVWDFSIKNYSMYKNIIPLSKLFYMPFVFCSDDSKVNKTPEYDILFYGAFNPRRNTILTKLEQKYKVYKGYGLFDDKLNDMISKSKMIINLHYYKDCALEIARINEVLQYNKLVISESASPTDKYNMDIYGNMVVYFDEINENYDNMEQLYDTINKYLNIDNYNDIMNKIKVNTPLLEKRSLFHLQKNMLIYENYINNNIRINKNKIKKVIYGKNDKFFDVTHILNEYALNNDTMSIKVDINKYFGDPYYGVTKILTIIYDTDEIIKINEIGSHLEYNILFCDDTEYKSLIDISKFDIEPIFDINEDDIYCLHLIETPFRINKFREQVYTPKVNIYPAIKYNPGFVGCGLSYRNILWNAKRCNSNTVTVCEDDCAFKPDFEDKYKIIKSFLKQYSTGWDIFVGCIANLPNDTIIKNVVNYEGMTFLEINKMHSTVFNIYNKSSYDSIHKWIDKNIDVKTYKLNQIDQHIKSQNLRIITTFPFEFQCTDVESTFNDINPFDIYNAMFNKSKMTIMELLQIKNIIRYDDIKEIKYGTFYKSVDITQPFKFYIYNNPLLYNIKNFTQLFGDPLPNKTKNIYIIKKNEEIFILNEKCSVISPNCFFIL